MGIRFRIADYRESVASRISGLISTGNFTESVMKQRRWASWKHFDAVNENVGHRPSCKLGECNPKGLSV